MRFVLGLIVLCLMVWGCVATVAGHYGINLYPGSRLLVFLMHVLAPWVALVGGFILWKQARTWRRLRHMRQPLPFLLRQGRFPMPRPERPSTLERWAAWMMGAGAVALIYWFKLSDPEIVLTAALLVWFFRGFAIGRLRRPDR